MAEAQEEVDFTKLPIDERCQHKNWKARVSGYEALTSLFQKQYDDTSPEFNKYAGIVRKFPVDSNAAAQEKALVAVFEFVEKASPSISGRVASEIISGIIAKCLISPKVKTKELAADIIKMYIEVEKQELVIEELLKGLDNKTPKIVASCIVIMRESLRDFGLKVLKPSPIIKYLPRGLEDRDKIVRDETKLLAIELFRWMNVALKSQLTGLKPVLMTELETEFDKLSGEKASPTRFLRSDQVRGPVNGNGPVEETDGAAASCPLPEEETDPFESFEPVEILNKLPSDFYTNCESKKWQERKQALDALQELLTPNPKIASGDYADLVKILKKFVQKDTMIPIVAAAAKCLADLASRLRKDFYPFSHSTISIILEKFKEKKQNVVVALREAIDAVILSTSLENVQEDIISSLDNKNPQIKAETAAFLTRQFSIMHFSVLMNKKLLKSFMDPLIKTLNDMDGSVRDASAEAIGTAMKVVGEKVMNPLLADVDAIKLAKIKEFHDKAEVKYPAPAGGHPVPKSAGSTAPVSVNRPAKAEGESKQKSSAPPRPKSTATIVNKAVSVKGIKSKTDCGRAPAKATNGRPTTAPGTKTSPSSTDDLTEDAAPVAKALSRPKSIIPPKSTAPNTSNIRSRIDCGLKKAAVSSPCLDSKPFSPAQQKTKIGTPKRQSLPGGNIPLSSARSSSPLEEEPGMRGRGSNEDLSDGENDPQPVTPIRRQVTTPMSRPSSTPRSDGKKILNGGRFAGSTGDILSPHEVYNHEAKLNVTMSQLSQIDPRSVSDGLRELLDIFERPEIAERILYSRVDQLVLNCSMQYRICLSKKLEVTTDALQRNERNQVLTVFRGVTSVLDAIFKHKELSKRASKESLGQLMPVILNIISDPKLEAIPEGSDIIRSVNMVATSVVTLADPTSLLSVLISLLIDAISNSNTQDKYTELVFKCLWKVSRMVESFVHELDLDRFFLDVHEFFVKFPASYWKEEGRKDIPQRTIKTITFLVVQQVGETALTHFALIPQDAELARYVQRIIRDMAKKQAPKTNGINAI